MYKHAHLILVNWQAHHRLRIRYSILNFVRIYAKFLKFVFAHPSNQFFEITQHHKNIEHDLCIILRLPRSVKNGQ